MLTKLVKFLKNMQGAAIIEAALCIPIVLYLLFFILEAVKVAIYQITLDSIAIESAFEYSAFKDTSKFDAILKKNLPFSAMSKDDIRCYINVYPSLEKLASNPSFGGKVIWPTTKVASANVSTVGFSLQDVLNGRVRSGAAFELTIVCDYKFTSAFVSKLFAGGSNSEDGKHFFIWSRAACVCN